MWLKKKEKIAMIKPSADLIADVGLYINEHFKPEPKLRVRDMKEIPPTTAEDVIKPQETYREARFSLSDSEDYIPMFLRNELDNLDESFMTYIFRLIDSKGLKDSDVYKKANIDRRLFSKMRKDDAYMPSFRTALALAVALELDLKETENLLRKARYALSYSKKFDVIVRYFIERGIYNIYEINEVLLHYDQTLLGG